VSKHDPRDHSAIFGKNLAQVLNFSRGELAVPNALPQESPRWHRRHFGRFISPRHAQGRQGIEAKATVATPDNALGNRGEPHSG